MNAPALRGSALASYLLVAATLLLVMWQGLLSGLLCVCIGFLATRWLARAIGAGLARLRLPRPGTAGALAVLLVLLGPLALLTLGLSQSRTYILDAPEQYRELLNFIARTVLELRDKLPPDLAAYLPEGAQGVQRMVASYLHAQAGTLALAGRAWLHTLLFAYVGLVVGSLASAAAPVAARRPLAAQLHRRATLFGDSFRQIVAAQFWIAAFNAFLTAVFLLLALPLADIHLPYRPALVTLTFLAGLVPIVGNLVCNAVMTLVGLSVSPTAALACLAFLVLIHKAEYVINAKVVGARTQMAVWELLAVMFVAEAVFGPAGLVAAPLFYAYAKKELQAHGLV
ncbi:AI-2E family transporter [Ramlibacter sp. H39-3-26]|uniref:AI-2E family transporter n=1 Tax=Curvibacter soli TaxID=3031331 RepID=UPI0023DCE06C|nr:AI-2E family transporter [Ramlibacter sp. H39-3-26]MDF1485414.1 AI-2E family transporter [Ramlibacter sp. H39-3-26]